MADASGTPTSPDNIPTYNTGVDPPSGKGFNTAMAQIQAIITNLKAGTLASGKLLVGAISATGTPSSTTFLRGDGTWSSAGVKTTTSTLAGGPPVSPSDGDIWIATSVDANGTRWQFQFDGTASNWKFIGGPPVQAVDASAFSFASTGGFLTYTTRVSFTAVRAGIYSVWGGFSGGNSSGALGSYTMGAGIAGSVVAKLGWITTPTATNWSVVGQPFTVTAAAGQTINAMYACDQAGVSGQIGLAIQPIRIS